MMMENAGARDVLEGLVRLGLLTREEADRCSMDIDLVVMLVSGGCIPPELGDAIIRDMAEELAIAKTPEWREEPLPEWLGGMAN